jgi:hypothetical protein
MSSQTKWIGRDFSHIMLIQTDHKNPFAYFQICIFPISTTYCSPNNSLALFNESKVPNIHYSDL